MKHSVRLFARARDLAGAETITVELPQSARVRDLRSALAEQCPPLAPLVPSLLVAVGTDYAGDADQLPASAEVAVFPPVSGG